MKTKGMMSIAFVSILLLTTTASTIPKASSTGGAGVQFLAIYLPPAPYPNLILINDADALGAAIGGPLIYGVATLPPVPPMVAGPGGGGPGSGSPWPFAGFIGPPQIPIALSLAWGSVSTAVSPGPLFDVYVPVRVWGWLGAGPTTTTWGPFTLSWVAWGAGVDLGVEGWGGGRGPGGLIIYGADLDGDLLLEEYARFYIRDPGVVTFHYSAPPPVGGFSFSVDVSPVDEPAILPTPYIGLASTVIVATAAMAIYVKRVKHREEKQ